MEVLSFHVFKLMHFLYGLNLLYLVLKSFG